jgi:hypothetical protein
MNRWIGAYDLTILEKHGCTNRKEESVYSIRMNENKHCVDKFVPGYFSKVQQTI